MRSVHSGILLTFKREEILTQATIWIDLEDVIMPSEIKTDTKKPIL